MKWTVLYTPQADQELAAAWLAAQDRNAVAKASNLVDACLAADPENTGVPCSNGARYVVEPPLCVEFEISGFHIASKQHQ